MMRRQTPLSGAAFNAQCCRLGVRCTWRWVFVGGGKNAAGDFSLVLLVASVEVCW